MKRSAKLWTGLGIAAVAGALAAEPVAVAQTARPLLLAQAEGEGGEGGGEGGGDAPTTYALGSTDPNAFNYDAKAQIEAYVDLVHTAYGRAAADAKTMQAAIDAFLTAPSPETLGAARKAWVDARPAYLRTEAFRFYDGPIEQVEGDINAWPMNEAYIDYVEGSANAGLVNDPSVPLDAATIGGLNQKQDEADVTVGWHAIEFLLWGQDLSAQGPGNRPYTDYIAGERNNDRRRAYLQLVTAKLVSDVDGLATAWEDYDRLSLAARLKTMPQREAIGRMVNGMAILAGFEFMSERLAVALDSGDQEDEHSCFSDTTKQDFVHDLEGIRQVWTGDADGKTRPGLDDLVRAIDAPLAAKVDDLFAGTQSKVNALGDPWDQVLAAAPGSAQRQAAEDVVVALQSLADGLVEAGNKLGVLVLVPKS